MAQHKTADGTVIVPGLRVQVGTIWQFTGTVQASQWETRRTTGPDRPHWDGLFWVELDNGKTAKYLPAEMRAMPG